MIDRNLLEQLDGQLKDFELEHSTFHFDFELGAAESSMFDLLDEEQVEQLQELIPKLVKAEKPIPFSVILKDWVSEKARKRETYVYLVLAIMFVVVFGRITTAIIDEEKMRIVELPEMMTPPPTPTPPPPPEEETPEPTPPEEETPEMPTPKPLDRMDQRLEELDQAQELEELQIEEPQTEMARDMQDNRLNAVRDRDNSTGSISRRFSRVTNKPRDGGNADLSRVGRGTARRESSGTASLGAVGTGRRARDTGTQQQLGDVAKKKKTGSGRDSGSIGNVEWIKLPSTGPVAHLQPRCRGRSGFIFVGQYRLKCGNDQIVAAWIKKQ